MTFASFELSNVPSSVFSASGNSSEFVFVSEVFSVEVPSAASFGVFASFEATGDIKSSSMSSMTVSVLTSTSMLRISFSFSSDIVS